MRCETFSVAVLCILSFSCALASAPTQAKQFLNHKDWNFVENKGQLMDEYRHALNDVTYYGHQGGVYLYCKPGMLSFVFTKVEKNGDKSISEATGSFLPCSDQGRREIKPSIITTCRNDLVLLNSNSRATILASDRREYYENYYTTGDADHGITNVHTYKTITYQNIYTHIDLVLNCRKQGLEYSFVIHPGGKVSDIQMQWNGTEGMQALANGGFKFRNELGTLEESEPRSFVEGKMVSSSFLRKGFGFGFNVGRYDEGKDLVIDPNLIWGTYFGENGWNDAFSVVTTDTNLYITGATQSTSGIATSGAFQTSLAGDYNAFLAKFNMNGSLLWATYYGGFGNVSGDGVTIDNSGNVYITGNTSSTSGIATHGAYQTSLGGGGTGLNGDAFLAKFSSRGSLQWGTYYGGSGEDDASGIAVDSSGVYITGGTDSPNGIATSGAYQTSWAHGGNAFLAKFSTTGSLKWATYYGGGKLIIVGDSGIYTSDEASGVAIDHSGNIYITGNTASSTKIATAGAYQTSFGGKSDAFLAKFNTNGSLQWATYYGGSGVDGGRGIAVDISDDIYIIGSTSSKSGMATSEAYQTSNMANFNLDNVFLAKFTSGGTLKWATYFGGEGPDYGNAVVLDGAKNIFITGTTSSASGIATAGAYQTAFNGGIKNAPYQYDGFIAKFSDNGSLNWATYYGGNGIDKLEDIDVDNANNLYIVGNTTSTSGISTTGSYQPDFISRTSLNQQYDVFIAKFNSCDFTIR